jgi:YHS domain-containing protein
VCTGARTGYYHGAKTGGIAALLNRRQQKAAGSSEYQGKTYYFCSVGCKRKFDQNPEQYAKS